MSFGISLSNQEMIKFALRRHSWELPASPAKGSQPMSCLRHGVEECRVNNFPKVAPVPQIPKSCFTDHESVSKLLETGLARRGVLPSSGMLTRAKCKVLLEMLILGWFSIW